MLNSLNIGLTDHTSPIKDSLNAFICFIDQVLLGLLCAHLKDSSVLSVDADPLDLMLSFLEHV